MPEYIKVQVGWHNNVGQPDRPRYATVFVHTIAAIEEVAGSAESSDILLLCGTRIHTVCSAGEVFNMMAEAIGE